MYITWTDLGLLVLFIAAMITFGYLIVLIKNINASASVLKSILKENKENINETLKEVPVVAKNLTELTHTAKDEFKVIGSTLNNINETVQMTAAAANTVKNDFSGKVKVIIDIIGVLWKTFFKSKEEDSEKERKEE